jgi:hypothetical protein
MSFLTFLPKFFLCVDLSLLPSYRNKPLPPPTGEEKISGDVSYGTKYEKGKTKREKYERKKGEDIKEKEERGKEKEKEGRGKKERNGEVKVKVNAKWERIKEKGNDRWGGGGINVILGPKYKPLLSYVLFFFSRSSFFFSIFSFFLFSFSYTHLTINTILCKVG